MAERSASLTAKRPVRGAPVADVPPLPAIDVLLNRVVVVEGGRSAELVVGLTAAGIPARAVGGGALQTMIAGLVVFDDSSEDRGVFEALHSLRQRQGPIAGVMLSYSDRAGLASALTSCADAVLPSDAPVEAIVAQLRVLARLIAVEPPSGEPEILAVRNLTIDLVHRHARAAGQLLELTPTEFMLLAHLARRRGVVSHGELFREVHGYGISEREAKSILKVHIWRLRAKLEDALPGENPIVTVRGFGYLLDRRNSRAAVRRP